MARVLASFLAIFALAFFAACGGDDDSSSTDNDSEETPAATLADTEDGDDGGDNDADDDSDADDGAPATLEACDLLTAAEISAELGYEVTEGVEQGGLVEDSTACQWDSSDPGVIAFVNIETLGEGGTAFYEATADPDMEPVDGVGDEARWSGLAGALDAVEGDVMVTVQVLYGFGTETGSAMDTAAAIATAALAAAQ